MHFLHNICTEFLQYLKVGVKLFGIFKALIICIKKLKIKSIEVFKTLWILTPVKLTTLLLADTGVNTVHFDIVNTSIDG